MYCSYCMHVTPKGGNQIVTVDLFLRKLFLKYKWEDKRNINI